MFLFSVYNKFKKRKWSKLDNAQKIKVLEKVEKKFAKKLGRQILPLHIVYDPNWQCYGMFENVNGKSILHLNSNLLDDDDLRFHALETIIHEGRHAYQHEVITKKRLGFFNFKARAWKQNYQGYTRSSEDRALYSMQPIERDAQKYTIKQMQKFEYRFKNDEDYKRTMHQLVHRYDKSEQELKEKHGLFYRRYIKKRMNEKAKDY